MFFRLPIVKFFSRLLNRATITVALVLLQAGWLLWAFSYLTTGRIWVNAALRLLSLFIVLYLVRKDEDSAYKIGWIVLIGHAAAAGRCAVSGCLATKHPAKGTAPPDAERWRKPTRETSPSSPGRRWQAGRADHFSGLSRYVARYGPYPGVG